MRTDEYTNIFELEDRFWWYRGIHDLIVRYVDKEATRGSLSIFDAGCGTGKLMMLLTSFGEVAGVDASPEALRYCRQRGLANVAIADLNEWSPAGITYSVLTCIDVLCHEMVRDVGAVLSRFHQALEPGGLLVLNLPAFESLRRQHDTVVQTLRRYRKEEFLPLLAGRGFEVELATYRLPPLFYLIRLQKWLRPVSDGSAPPRSDLHRIPRFLDALLWQMHRIENLAIFKGARFGVGSSLFVLARKREVNLRPADPGTPPPSARRP